MEERLHKFVRLVDEGSFTKAAESMHISQPALTVAIAKLERELGTQLLVRDTRPLELTDAGKIVYNAGIAQAVVLDNLHTELSDLVGRRPSVAVGMIDSVAAVLSAYSKPLSEFGQEADLSVIVNESRLLRESSTKRMLDLAFVITDSDAKTEKHIADELMVLVVSPMERTAKEAELKEGKLTDFISYPQTSATYDLTRRAMKTKKIDFKTRLQSSSPEVITHMVVSGEGVAILPYFMVRGHLITGALAVMQIGGEPFTFARSLSVASVHGKHQAKSVTVFIDQVADVLKAAYNEAVKAVNISKGRR